MTGKNETKLRILCGKKNISYSDMKEVEPIIRWDERQKTLALIEQEIEEREEMLMGIKAYWDNRRNEKKADVINERIQELEEIKSILILKLKEAVKK